MMASASSRTVFLTGAAGGIGLAMTQALLAAGHTVAAVDRDAKALDRLAAEHSRSKDRLHPIRADLSTPAGCEAAIAEAHARFGALDAVINNAGIGMSSVRPDAEVRTPGIEELTPEIWDGFLAIFVRAPVMLVRAALPDMRRSGFGRIINNTTSYVTMLRVLPYGAVKAALESMSAVWAKELDGSGITVNVLVPGGPTDTPFIADEAGWPREKMLRPAIMGPPTAWLISDEARAFTGRRVTAARWDKSLPPAEAAALASRPIGWPELAADAVWLTGGKD
jgi:NAD(P)-dependent dehydrogenase (short-subunit alcohol dehydrogenase family)